MGLHLHSGDYTYTLQWFSNSFPQNYTYTYTFISFGVTNVIQAPPRVIIIHVGNSAGADSNLQGAVKGVYLKGSFAQSRLFYREMDCPVRFYREMDCPVRWSLATPSALESQSRANQGSVVANPICKCRRHKAGHLQVRVAVGRQSTCVLKEAPLNKGPLRFPQTLRGNI